MFGLLKKKLKESVQKLVKKAEENEEAEQKIEERMKASGVLKKIHERVTTRQLSPQEIDDFFSELDIGLMQSNVAVEVIDFFKKSLKEKLGGRQIKRGDAQAVIRSAFEDSLLEVVDQGTVDMESMMKKDRPLKCVVLGFNGSGKTTTIAKLASQLKHDGHRPVLAAGDTFRAASIEQLEVHAEKLGVKIVKHQYGADSAAVMFDAVKHAETNHCDIVLADTAGRVHTDKNLMDELKKVVRVNSPDLKILVIDSLTGNDAIEQAKEFDKAVGVDAVVLTKVDVNEKGGSILSVCYAIKKPVLFLGVGQDYKDLKKFNPKEFVKNLLE